jgi:23S rRNA (uracil1939-C5)-methyltransferase
LPGEEQRVRKLSVLREGLRKIEPTWGEREIEFLPVAEQALRDRVDLVFQSGNLGFYQKNQREAFEVESCPLMSPALHGFYQDFRSLVRFPIRKGSLRLRVSADGSRRGIWLDFANEDIRDLLSEKTILSKLLDLGFVEIGQRRKKLGGDFKLKDPEFHPWTRTWNGEQAIDLFSVVGGFSQSGDLANRVLISQMQKYFQRSTSRQWVEFGCGNGNLTLPLAGTSPDRRVKALEYDSLALAGFQRTLADQPEFISRIDLQQGDFQKHEAYNFSAEEGVLVNPPRSGLIKFLDPLFETSPESRPQDFIYMSCHPDSFLADAEKLFQLKYSPQDISLVDQFPHSPHFEILSRWQLTNN